MSIPQNYIMDMNNDDVMFDPYLYKGVTPMTFISWELVITPSRLYENKKEWLKDFGIMFTYDSPEEEGKLKGILQPHTRILFALGPH